MMHSVPQVEPTALGQASKVARYEGATTNMNRGREQEGRYGCQSQPDEQGMYGVGAGGEPQSDADQNRCRQDQVRMLPPRTRLISFRPNTSMNRKPPGRGLFRSGFEGRATAKTWHYAGSLPACGGTLGGRAQGYSGHKREMRSGAMPCHHDRRTTKPEARRPLRPSGVDGMGPAAALPLSPDIARWGASTSSLRLASGPMAFVTRPPRVPPQAACL